MKKILTLVFTLFYCLVFSQDSLFNAARIGQLGRNQMVDNGLWVKDTLLVNNVIWYPNGAGVGKILVSDANGNATWQTVSLSSSLSIGDTVTNARTGSILFTTANGVLSQDSSLFNWDNSTKQMGIGILAGSSSRLLIRGVNATSSSHALRVQNNSVTPAELFNVRNDNFIGIGTVTEQSITSAGTNFIRANISGTNYLSLFSNGGVFIGAGATGTATGTAGLGYRGVAIGFNAEANTTGNQGTDQQGIAVGQSALAYAGGIAIGSGARTGFSAITGAGGAIAIGHNISASSSSSNSPPNIAIGSSAAILQGVINIGRNNTFTGSNFNSTGWHTLLGNNLTIASASGRSSIIALGYGANTAMSIGNSFQIYLAGQAERSFFLNSNGNVVLRNNQTIVPITNYDENATNTLTLHNGTAPTTNITDAFQLYSADRVAGQAGAIIRSENGTRHIFSDIVGINTITPDASAALDVVSTTRGFLPPRMTTAQRDAIVSPAAGILIFNITTNKFSGFDGTNWHDFH